MKLNVRLTALKMAKKIFHETRSFDAASGGTFSMRSKEAANDYRYFPEPDLLPVMVDDADIEAIRSNMPALPQELFDKYTRELGLSEYDASIITDSKSIAMYFEELIEHSKNYKAAANWLMGDVKSFLNEQGIHISEFPIQSSTLAELISLVDDQKISNSVASQKVFPALLKTPDQSPESIAKANNWIQESNEDALIGFIDAALAKYPDKVEEYKSGKKGLLGMFMGEVMKMSKGKADPKLTNKLLSQKLEA